MLPHTKNNVVASQTAAYLKNQPGYIAANAIADDLQLEHPWARVPAPEWRH
jgi:hypothetical protein